MISIKLSPTSRITSITKLPQHIIFCWKENREKQEEITFSSKLWETKKEIFTALATWTTSLLIRFKRSKLQAKLWCTRRWEVALKSTKSLNQKLALYRPKKDSGQSSILQLRSTWSKWTKFRRKEPNQLHKLDLLIWCQTLSKMVWISMPWLTVPLQILWFTKTIKILEELKVSLQLKELMECK